MGNNYAGGQRREQRSPAASGFNGTGALPALPGTVPVFGGAFDLSDTIASLRELFARDRQLASQQENRRCGICYLHFQPGDLHYREMEGFYVCPQCERALGKTSLPMIRRQQK